MSGVSGIDQTVLDVQVLASAFMAGLIWFVQLVHYPLFAAVPGGAFVDYERRHRNRTAAVVGLPMVAEGVTTLWLFLAPPGDLGRTLPFIGGVLLTVVLASTVLVQVPLHDRLSTSYDRGHIRRLVATNWVRTVGWSARAVLALAMLHAA